MVDAIMGEGAGSLGVGGVVLAGIKGGTDSLCVGLVVCVTRGAIVMFRSVFGGCSTPFKLRNSASRMRSLSNNSSKRCETRAALTMAIMGKPMMRPTTIKMTMMIGSSIGLHKTRRVIRPVRIPAHGRISGVPWQIQTNAFRRYYRMAKRRSGLDGRWIMGARVRVGVQQDENACRERP